MCYTIWFQRTSVPAKDRSGRSLRRFGLIFWIRNGHNVSMMALSMVSFAGQCCQWHRTLCSTTWHCDSMVRTAHLQGPCSACSSLGCWPPAGALGRSVWQSRALPVFFGVVLGNFALTWDTGHHFLLTQSFVRSSGIKFFLFCIPIRNL